jgi:hypothetical protein
MRPQARTYAPDIGIWTMSRVMTQGQERRGRHADVDLATVKDSHSTCQTSEMFEMGQKKASGCLPCRAIRRMIDFSPVDFFHLAFFLRRCTVAHGEKARPTGATGGWGHAIH